MSESKFCITREIKTDRKKFRRYFLSFVKVKNPRITLRKDNTDGQF